MDKVKNIALVAHDTCKKDLIEWVDLNWQILASHRLICTGTTGRLVEECLTQKLKSAGVSQDLCINRLKSGPLGGDQQLGALITEGKIDMVFFMWDPMQPQPHDVDVKALLRLTVLYNVITATNRSTADFIITSPYFNSNYVAKVKDYSGYVNRSIH